MYENICKSSVVLAIFLWPSTSCRFHYLLQILTDPEYLVIYIYNQLIKALPLILNMIQICFLLESDKVICHQECDCDAGKYLTDRSSWNQPRLLAHDQRSWINCIYSQDFTSKVLEKKIANKIEALKRNTFYLLPMPDQQTFSIKLSFRGSPSSKRTIINCIAKKW